MKRYDRAEDCFAGRLLNDEHILWTGRPRQGIILMLGDLGFIPFFLAGLGLSAADSRNGPGGRYFLLLILLMIVAGLLLDAWERWRLYYAVTNQRVLIARSAPFKKDLAFGLGRLPETRLKNVGSNGRGTIRLGSSASIFSWRGTPNIPIRFQALDSVPQLVAIENAKEVLDLIQRTKG